MRAGDIDHHRCIDLFTVYQRYAGYPAVVGFTNGTDLGIETKPAAGGFCGALDIVCGELRIVDVTGLRPEDRAVYLFAAGFTKMLIVRPFDRAELMQIPWR
jgi:hypothetical protein